MLKEHFKNWLEHFKETFACPICGTKMGVKAGYSDLYKCPGDNCETEVQKEDGRNFRVVITCRDGVPTQEVMPAGHSKAEG